MMSDIRKPLREGVITSITKWLIKGKVNALVKMFRSDPEIAKAVKEYDQARKKLDKSIARLDARNKAILNKKVEKV